MSSFDVLVKNVTSDEILSDAVEEILFEHREEILDLVRIQLESFGVDGSNKPITPEYRPYTVQIKKTKGQRYDHVTLNDTGNFHRSFYLQFYGTPGPKRYIETNAKDGKLEDLAEKYGEEIIDLNEQSVQTIIDEIIRPNLPKKLLNKWLKNV